MTQNNIRNAASIMDVDNIRLDGNTISSTDTNGNIVLDPDGTGSVVIRNSALVPSGDRAESLGSATNSWDNVYADGLTFDDGSNIMDAYVDFGSWTPVAEGLTTPGAGTYTQQIGTYTRIGNVVHAAFDAGWSAHTGTGTLYLTGLPFDAVTAENNIGSFLTISATTPPANFLWGVTRIVPGFDADAVFLQGTLDTGASGSYTVAASQRFRGHVTYFTS